MSTLKSINVIHPSSATNNIVNDASGNVTAGADLYVTGNVGVGTSSPGAKLHVAGFTLVGPMDTTTTYQGLTLRNGKDSSVAETTSFVDAQNNLSIADSNIFFAHQTDGGSFLGFATTPAGSRSTDRRAERMRIDSSGNLLVGYTSSNGAYKLQVNSQIFATSSTIATSDARYKQNVKTLNGALSIVKALHPVSFDWKEHPVHAFDTENTNVGFLAQEVQQVLAEKPYLNSIIKKNECVIEPEVKDENGDVTTAAVTEEFLGIAEGNMIAILTSAIQELSAKNDALEARLAALEAK
jgi:hypothetical protein